MWVVFFPLCLQLWQPWKAFQLRRPEAGFAPTLTASTELSEWAPFLWGGTWEAAPRCSNSWHRVWRKHHVTGHVVEPAVPPRQAANCQTPWRWKPPCIFGNILTKEKTYHVHQRIISALILLPSHFIGSATLQHWQQLAQPNLGGILDARPGVVPKGFRPLELDLEEVYHYSDYEEDEPGEQYFQNLPTTTMANTGLGHAPSASPSPCLSTGHGFAEFSGRVIVVK